MLGVKQVIKGATQLVASVWSAHSLWHLLGRQLTARKIAIGKRQILQHLALCLELLQRDMAKLGGWSIEEEDIPVLEAHGRDSGCLLSNVAASVANMVGEQWRALLVERKVDRRVLRALRTKSSGRSIDLATSYSSMRKEHRQVTRTPLPLETKRLPRACIMLDEGKSKDESKCMLEAGTFSLSFHMLLPSAFSKTAHDGRLVPKTRRRIFTSSSSQHWLWLEIHMLQVQTTRVLQDSVSPSTPSSSESTRKAQARRRNNPI